VAPMRFRFLAFVGKPFQTMTERRRAAWGGEPKRYHYTQPAAPRKQWKTVERFKRKAS
jgi:hypothetical protein